MEETADRGAEFGARLSSVAATQGIDARALLPVLDALEPELRRNARVTLSHAFSRLAVGCPWPSDLESGRKLVAAHGALAAHGPGFAAQAARLSDLAGDLESRVSVEAATIPRRAALGFAIRARRSQPLDAALHALVKTGELTPLARRQLTEAAELAGLRVADAIADRCQPPALRLWSFRFEECSVRDRSRVLAIALDLARNLGVDAGQRKLLGSVHKLLATAESTAVTLVACADELLPRVRVAYRGVRPQVAARLMEHLYPDERGAERVAALTAALAAERIASVDIGYGDFERPSARVCASWPPGRSTAA